MSDDNDNRGVRSCALAPLYDRLPRGPHGLGRGEVLENQRRRLHGGMIESVARQGYGRTSVRHVIALAGVSRRAFYEQFANKHACFSTTRELIARRARALAIEALGTSDGTVEHAVATAVRDLVRAVDERPKSARLLLVESPSVGPAGWQRLTGTLGTFEDILAGALESSPSVIRPPRGVATGVVGGLWMMTFVRLREPRRTPELDGLAEQAIVWLQSILGVHQRRAAATEPRARQLGAEAIDVGRLTETRDAPAAPAPRERVMWAALSLVRIEGYAELVPLRVADEAAVPVDVFFELFDDVEECVLAAVEHVARCVGEATLGVDPSAGPAPAGDSASWPSSVRRTLASLTGYLAVHPLHAHTLAAGVFSIGKRAVDLSVELIMEIAGRLTDGAPGPPVSPVAVEGIAGAVWHTVCRQLAAGSLSSLPGLADELALLVLAPYIGLEEARRTLASPPDAHLCEVGDQHADKHGDHDHDDQRRLA